MARKAVLWKKAGAPPWVRGSAAVALAPVPCPGRAIASLPFRCFTFGGRTVSTTLPVLGRKYRGIPRYWAQDHISAKGQTGGRETRFAVRERGGGDNGRALQEGNQSHRRSAAARVVNSCGKCHRSTGRVGVGPGAQDDTGALWSRGWTRRRRGGRWSRCRRRSGSRRRSGRWGRCRRRRW